MKFTTSKKYQLEAFISSWHWDKTSHKFAIQVGAFLFGFMDYLVQSGASDRVYRTHKGNLWNIGIFTCQYGYHERFSPNIFKSPPFHEYEFKRKMSNTAYALKSYSATCNQLSKYATKKLYKTVEPVELELSDQIKDFLVGLHLLETNNRKSLRGDVIDFNNEIKMIQESYIHDLGGEESREEFLKRTGKCLENLDKIEVKMEALLLDGHYNNLKIRKDLQLDVRELKNKVFATTMNV